MQRHQLQKQQRKIAASMDWHESALGKLTAERADVSDQLADAQDALKASLPAAPVGSPPPPPPPPSPPSEVLRKAQAALA